MPHHKIDTTKRSVFKTVCFFASTYKFFVETKDDVFPMLKVCEKSGTLSLFFFFASAKISA